MRTAAAGIFAVAAIVILVWFMNREEDWFSRTSFLSYIQESYAPEGLVQAYPGEDDTFLSESEGLYLLWLAEQGEEDVFRAQVERMEEAYIERSGGETFLRWKLGADAVNALIDDERMIEALRRGAEAFDEPAYTDLAEELEASLERHLKNGDVLLDFYDWELEAQSETFHLKYGRYETWEALGMEGSFQLLYNQENLFWDEVYDTEKEELAPASDEADMIDQLLIASAAEEAGVDTSAFAAFVQEEWEERGLLYGRYDRQEHTPSVDYESMAVYGIGAAYMEQRGDSRTAEAFIERGQELFEQADKDDVHFFDLIWYAPSS
ncbi:hypothetical protein [Alkalicoccus chagannorensis]|uniref:hypothetical protein n=1 Tax=Alkalicoccus chagannorensis TaxID=427072 RepID=UPI00041BD928|nr:hypothetical protein [Alkalicoccus chagannorensis]